jgi:DNA-binding HxlR family transcriptional regulator
MGVVRTVVSENPLNVEYAMTSWRQSFCPALDALLAWIEGQSARRPMISAQS